MWQEVKVSLFAIRKLYPYSRSDYLAVVKGVLVRREKTSPELAEDIAASLDGRLQDVRDAVRAARLAPSLGWKRRFRSYYRRGRGSHWKLIWGLKSSPVRSCSYGLLC